MKKFLILLLSFLLALSFSACFPSDYGEIDDTPKKELPAPQTAEELYCVYSALDRDMTKAEIEAMFGEGEPSLDDYGDIKFFNYFNDSGSAGASVIYDENDVLKTKTLWFNTKENLVPFSARYKDELVREVVADETVKFAGEIMGAAPLELSCTYLPDGPLSTNKIYAWYNEDASNLMIHTENDVITNVVLYRD